MGREIGSKSILLTLTYPMPRSYYLCARFAAILALLAVAALLLASILWAMVFVSHRGYEQAFNLYLGLPFWFTVLGLWVDAAVVAAFALLIACLATVPMLSFALGMAFAIAGKTLGAVLDYFVRGADGDTSVLKMAPLLDAIQWVLPDLSRLDWRAWPLYGVSPGWGDIGWPLVMAVGYVLCMLSLAVLAFKRREFM